DVSPSSCDPPPDQNTVAHTPPEPIGGITHLLDDQRRRWLLGEHIPVEAYRQRYPELSQAPSELLDLIYQEILLREGLGETPELREYLRRFPEHEEALRRQFSIHRALRCADAPGEDPGAAASGLPSGPDSPTLLGGRYQLLEEIGAGG